VDCKIVRPSDDSRSEIVLGFSSRYLKEASSWEGQFFDASPASILVYLRDVNQVKRTGLIRFHFILDMQRRLVTMYWDFSEAANGLPGQMGQHITSPMALNVEYTAQAFSGALEGNILDVSGDPLEEIKARCQIF
jgi:hypothetical protein